MGTFVLVFMGNGVVAGNLLRGTKSENSGWMVITAGWAFAVFCGVVTAVAFGSPEAHLNPAVTLAVAIHTNHYGILPVFVAAQMLGATAGATVVWLFYYPHWTV